MKDLKLIKKHYGEKMMHLCRELFPTILENEGLLWSILTSNYPYSKHLYDDVKILNNREIFKRTILSFVKEEDKKEIDTGKTPKELLEEAGYDFYECHSEDDIQKFKKYYTEDEELCTFRGGRLNRCFVFWVVKKNVDTILREDFAEPKREDEYGTSVMSIQFARDGLNTLSIKNRYNHTLKKENPDATFSNNLDNIIPGLKKSFEKTYNLNLSNLAGEKLLSGYVQANDGKYYKYNYEINNVYYCPDNIIIDNFEVKKYDKSKYLIIDYFIVDLVNKTIKTYNDDAVSIDSFVDNLKDIKNIKIEVDKASKDRTITINNDIVITVDKTNKIASYKNEHIRHIDESFLIYNRSLSNIELPNVEYIDDYFLISNANLKKIDFPKLKVIGNEFINNNSVISSVNLPEVREIGDKFILKTYLLNKIFLPKVESIGDHFLEENKSLYDIDISNAKYIGDNCLLNNESLRNIDLSNAITIGSNLLNNNMDLNNIKIDSLKNIGSNYFVLNRYIKNIIKSKIEMTNNHYR